MLRVTSGAPIEEEGAAWATALLPYASAQGFPWFVADLGTPTVNPMAREGYALKRGDVLDFAVRLVVQDGDVEEADVAGLWGALLGEVLG